MKQIIDAKFILAFEGMVNNQKSTFYIAETDEKKGHIDLAESVNVLELANLNDFWTKKPKIFDSGVEAGKCLDMIATDRTVAGGKFGMFKNELTQHSNYEVSKLLSPEYLEIKLGMGQ